MWLTPHVEREAELREVLFGAAAAAAEATSFVASLGALGRAGGRCGGRLGSRIRALRLRGVHL